MMSRERYVIDDMLFLYVFCIQNVVKNSQQNLNLIVLPNTRFRTYQNLKPRVNELCDTCIPDVIFNFCVLLCFLFMEGKLYSASKLIDL